MLYNHVVAQVNKVHHEDYVHRVDLAVAGYIAPNTAVAAEFIGWAGRIARTGRGAVASGRRAIAREFSSAGG